MALVMTCAWLVACSRIERARAVLAAMSPTVALICSVAVATEARLLEDCSMSEATESGLALASSAAEATVWALWAIDAVPEAVCLETADNSVAAEASVLTPPEMPPSSRRRFSVIACRATLIVPNSSLRVRSAGATSCEMSPAAMR